MRYLLLLLILVSCNDARYEKAEPIAVSDTVSNLSDSITARANRIDSIIDQTTASLQTKIDRLTKEKEALESITVESYKPSDQNNEYRVDERDKKIYELTKKIMEYEAEIASLKKKLKPSDSSIRQPVISKAEPVTPNDSSLVVQFDPGSKYGNIPTNNLSVFIIPYSKKAKRRFMQYEINCDFNLIEKMNGKVAGYYNGIYFFNNVDPGKYLIKVCSYYGGYEVVDRSVGYQVVKMQVAPPVQ